MVAIAFRTLLSAGSQGHQVAGEPVTGQYRDPLEGAGFFEKVGGARNHNKPAPAGHCGLCAALQFQHHGVAAPHDQQCRRDHVGQRLARQIGPSPARHDRCHLHPGIGGRDQGRARCGAGAEIADGQRRRVTLAPQPAGDID